MGMDLIPKRNEVKSFHFNWSGWHAVISILEQLDVNMSEMSTCNDGIPVCEATCKEWSKALNTALTMKRIYVHKVKDPTYIDFYKYNYVVVDGRHDAFIKGLDTKLTQIDRDVGDWIQGFIKFLNTCKGFKQY